MLPYKVDELIASIPLKELVAASKELSSRYKSQTFRLEMRHRIAYLAVRAPATFEVILRVFKEVNHSVRHFLDIGAGPGTGMWAAKQTFGSLERITLIEKESQFITLGKEIDSEGIWHKTFNETLPHDLVLLSYSLCEMAEKEDSLFLKKLWDLTTGSLVIIEPGTPKAFERMRKVRKELIEMGAEIVAPCPHSQTCPMAGGDWCHFSARLSRTSTHRLAKEAALGYEDEKFCYLIASRHPPLKKGVRILRHPQKKTGHMQLSLCTKEGLESKIFSRRDKENYHQIKKLDWGDFIYDDMLKYT